MLIAGIDAVEAAYQKLASLPLETLSRSELHALLARLARLDAKWVALDRKLIGRLITEADPTNFGGASWAEVLSRKLRISHGEAQRRIAEAIYAAAPQDNRTSARS